ncbi:MAG: iron export ABC transporter permease subunit FetB [Pseudomonadota bacterium]|nr:iron export ABC transporter permease subunit FetB [Pseudomonadota bacterium]
MNLIQLSAWDLAISASLIGILALLSVSLQLRVARELLVAAGRMIAQLLLVGLVLKALFSYVSLWLVGAVSLVMLAVAGYEVMQRQTRPFRGVWGYGMGTASMFASSFTLTIFALLVPVSATPWYHPQYAIPLLGMILGNTMNGISLALDRVTQSCWDQRETIEQRLMLGQTGSQALAEIRRYSIRSGLIPIINAMAVAGIVSLPGMMTGQILAGAPPEEAVKYQILIMFLIAGGSGLGTLVSVQLSVRRLFDQRDRLRLERLRLPSSSGAK